MLLHFYVTPFLEAFDMKPNESGELHDIARGLFGPETNSIAYMTQDPCFVLEAHEDDIRRFYGYSLTEPEPLPSQLDVWLKITKFIIGKLESSRAK